ncbi:hypothetical protein SRHO_G00031870 [Serrasalmus rhombeus]
MGFTLVLWDPSSSHGTSRGPVADFKAVTTPEVTFSLPSETLDVLFSALLLDNETPEPEHEQISSGDEEKTLLGDPKDSKVPSFFQRTAE